MALATRCISVPALDSFVCVWPIVHTALQVLYNNFQVHSNVLQAHYNVIQVHYNVSGSL